MHSLYLIVIVIIAIDHISLPAYVVQTVSNEHDHDDDEVKFYLHGLVRTDLPSSILGTPTPASYQELLG